jgi:hypothetical protein
VPYDLRLINNETLQFIVKPYNTTSYFLKRVDLQGNNLYSNRINVPQDVFDITHMSSHSDYESYLFKAVNTAFFVKVYNNSDSISIIDITNYLTDEHGTICLNITENTDSTFILTNIYQNNDLKIYKLDDNMLELWASPVVLNNAVFTYSMPEKNCDTQLRDGFLYCSYIQRNPENDSLSCVTQKINQNGEKLWGVNGKTFYDEDISATDHFKISVNPLGFSSVYFNRKINDYKISFYDDNGNSINENNPITIISTTYGHIDDKIFLFNYEDKLISVWKDSRNGVDNLFCQISTSEGENLCTKNGKQIFSKNSFSMKDCLIKDGIVYMALAYQENENIIHRLFSLNVETHDLLNIEGIVLGQDVNYDGDNYYQHNAKLKYENNGCYYYWNTGTPEGLVYIKGQKSDGLNTFWDTDGKIILNKVAYSKSCIIIPDEIHENYLCWKENNTNYNNCFVLRLNSEGMAEANWNQNGVSFNRNLNESTSILKAASNGEVLSFVYKTGYINKCLFSYQ